VAILRAGPAQRKTVPPICNSNAVVTCPHQGGVAKLVPKQMVVNIGGVPAMRATDMPGTPVMPGCPNLPTPATPNVPCSVVVSPAMPASTKVFIQGQPAMLSTGLMTTNCVAPIPNGARVTFPGQTTVIAAS
jgi:hypothetical protein